MYCLMIVMIVLWCVVFSGSLPHNFEREQRHRGTPNLKVIKTSDHEGETETISSTKPTILVRNNRYNPNSQNKELQHHPDSEPPSGVKCEKVLKPELQLKHVKTKYVPTLRPLVYLKERFKRATIEHTELPPSSTTALDEKQNIKILLNDPGFLAYLEKVFPLETERINADRYARTTSALQNYRTSNKNNSGVDDRLIPLKMFHEIYDGNVSKKTSEDEKKSAATTLNNDVSFASYGATPDELVRGSDEQVQTILEIFGTPPPLAVINVLLKNESESTTDTLPTARKPQTSHRGNNENSAMNKKNTIYVYIVCSLIFIFILT